MQLVFEVSGMVCTHLKMNEKKKPVERPESGRNLFSLV